MSRPAGIAWQPLGYLADPVPGDPEMIDQEVRYLTSMANTITEQIAALRRISDEGVNVGQYAATLRSSARSLAGSMDLVATRCQRVVSALNAWIPELTQAQATSLAALNSAELPYAALNRATAAASHTSAQRAQAELDAAKALLARAVEARDTAAARCAGQIDDACHDNLQDSFWDRFEAFISDFSWLIKDACEVLEVIAAIAALAALFVTGADFLLLIAGIATAVALLGRTVLAATGNGSWLDVGLDAIALTGLGEGIRALDRADAILHDAIGVGDKLVEAERAEALPGKAAAFLDKVAEFMNENHVPDDLVKQVQARSELFKDYGAELRPLVSSLIKDVTSESSWERALAGGEGPATIAARLRTLVERFPQDGQIADLSSQISHQLTVSRTHTFGSLIAAAGGTVASGFPVYRPGGQEMHAYNWAFWDQLERALSTGHADVTTVQAPLR